MKIQEVKGFFVKPGWFLVKIETDEGLCGWGESAVLYTSKLQHNALAEAAAVLKGLSPLNIEAIWQKLFRDNSCRSSSVMMTVLSGIDQALWDIKGKFHGVPVYQLLGGACRDRVSLLSWIDAPLPDQLGVLAKKAMEKGFNAVKISAVNNFDYIDSYARIDSVIERVAAIREATDTYFGISVDFHGKIHKSVAKIMVRELDPYALIFIEDPVPYTNPDVLKKISQYSSVPIAAGEEVFSRWGFRQIFSNNLTDIVQPSVAHCGGISETRKIAEMAEAFDVGVVMHCTLGPVALISGLHLNYYSFNTTVQEENLSMNPENCTYYKKYIRNYKDFNFSGGSISLPEVSGLGIEIDEQSLEII